MPGALKSLTIYWCLLLQNAGVLVLSNIPSLDGKPETVKDFRVIGGTKARENQFPYQVSLQINYRHFCGGSIISREHVLTAAHCIIQKDSIIPAEKLQIMAGDMKLEGAKAMYYEVKVIFVNAKYSKYSFDNDIAIIKVRKPFVLSKAINIIPITNNPVPLVDASGCTVSGWGTTKQGSSTFPDHLLYANISIINRKKCIKAYQNLVNTSFCAGDSRWQMDACQGDSGGPLVCNGSLTGIVSFGEGCAQRDKPGAYTDVYIYVNSSWIKNQMERNISNVNFLNTIILIALVTCAILF